MSQPSGAANSLASAIADALSNQISCVGARGAAPPVELDPLVYQRFLDGISKLDKTDKIPGWVSNFERKCRLFNIPPAKWTEAALLSINDDVFSELKCRVSALAGETLAMEIPWQTLRKGLLRIGSAEHPLKVAALKLLTREPQLWHRSVSIDAGWRELCEIFEELFTAAEDELGPICSDVEGLSEEHRSQVEASVRNRFRKMLLSSTIMHVYPVTLPTEDQPYSLTPEKLFEQIRAVRVAAKRLTPG